MEGSRAAGEQLNMGMSTKSKPIKVMSEGYTPSKEMRLRMLQHAIETQKESASMRDRRPWWRRWRDDYGHYAVAVLLLMTGAFGFWWPNVLGVERQPLT